jgi:hypothetical protein
MAEAVPPPAPPIAVAFPGGQRYGAGHSGGAGGVASGTTATASLSLVESDFENWCCLISILQPYHSIYLTRQQ